MSSSYTVKLKFWAKQTRQSSCLDLKHKAVLVCKICLSSVNTRGKSHTLQIEPSKQDNLHVWTWSIWLSKQNLIEQSHTLQMVSLVMSPSAIPLFQSWIWVRLSLVVKPVSLCCSLVVGNWTTWNLWSNEKLSKCQKVVTKSMFHSIVLLKSNTY